MGRELGSKGEAKQFGGPLEEQETASEEEPAILLLRLLLREGSWEESSHPES